MYGLIWSVYGLACVLALICLFWLTAGIKSPTARWTLRMPFVALCFTPVQVDIVSQLWFAPSIAAIAIELIAEDVATAVSYLPLLLMNVLLAIAVGFLIAWFIGKKRPVNHNR